MLHKYNEMKIILNMMNNSGGCSNDYDDLISSCINNLSESYKALH